MVSFVVENRFMKSGSAAPFISGTENGTVETTDGRPWRRLHYRTALLLPELVTSLCFGCLYRVNRGISPLPLPVVFFFIANHPS